MLTRWLPGIFSLALALTVQGAVAADQRAGETKDRMVAAERQSTRRNARPKRPAGR